MNRRLSSLFKIAVMATLVVAIGAPAFAQVAAPDVAVADVSAPEDFAADDDAGEVLPSRNLLQIVYQGGPMMIPIGICSVILGVFVFERFVSLRRGRVIPRPFVKRMLEQLREGQLDQETALQLCDENKSPVASVFAGGLRKWGKPAVEVEQAILDEGERVANVLRRYLRMFNGISTLSPLLGLLGTVCGMINSFSSMSATSTMGKSEYLAAGISEALVTTAGGLAVAIPALVAYLFFVGKVDGLVMELDARGQELVGIIASDGWEKGTGEKTKKRSKAAA